MIGTLLQNRYRLDAELGRGGRGTVYRAHDTLLDRDVAVKVLSESNLGAEGRARLLHEAQAAAKLNHPNIVSVYDAGEASGVSFIVMELVSPRSLRDAGALTIPQVVDLACQLCDALDHAHTHGIIHRDIKPENILILPSPAQGREAEPGIRVKLVDFGLARSRATTRLTQEGTLVGTVFYLAPEQALGGAVDGRADLYALGVTLYELIAGRLPFTAEDPIAVISQHIHAPVVPPSTYNPNIPAALDALITRLLSKRPSDRPPSAADVRRMLDQLDVASAGERPLIERIVRGRLVARDQELAEAIAIWRKAMAGESGVLLISGAPGVGKTRLANEVIAHARLFGAQVLEGGCYEYEATTPYLPLTEALGDWAHAQATETLRERLGTTAAELARLVPEIQARLGPIAPNTPLPPDQERLRLFDHVARFLQSLAAPGGLLLFVDDLHWADHGTLSLIHYLLRRLRHERWLILGAYRDVELDRMHPLSASLVEWNRERWATRVQLSPLTLDGCSAMLAALFGQASVSPEFAQAIYRETEGNPFFIEEVIKSLIEQGQIYREAVRWERKAIAELTIPQSIKDAIGRRLNRLSADNLEVLQHAAVLGKTFDFTELSAAFGVAQPEDRLLDALDAALGAQLIQAGERNAFTFTHDKIRQALYEELNPIRRRRMHQYIGQGLERLYAGAALDAHVQDLAHHFLNSGDLDKALRYSVSAAEQARQLYAFDEALKYCKYAAESAEALNLTDQLPGLNETLGDIRSDRGVFFEAVENYQRALALTSSRDRQAHLKAKIGLAYAQVGDEHGLELLRSAQGELDPAIHPDDLARVLMALGRYHHYCAQHMQAIACLEQARELAEPSDDPFTLLHIYAFLAGAYQHLARYDESLHWARQCIALGERKNYPPAIALGHEFLSEDFCVMGRWPAGLEHARLDLQIGEKIGAQDRVAWSAYGHTFGLFGLGRLKEAREAAQFGLEMADQIGDNRLSVWLSCLLALIKTDLGTDDAAQASADVALSRADELGQVVLQCWSRYALAYVHLARQEWDRALQVCQQGVELYTPTENRISRLVLGSVLAEALSGTGRLDEAIAHLAEYVPFARQSQWHHFEAVALRVQGQVLAAQSQWEAAEYAFGDAIAKLDELGSRLELGRALVHRARLRWTMGHTDSADADVMRARALFQECGAVRDAALAADLDE